MLFNSLIFLVFAAFFYSLWPLFHKRNNLRWGYLVIASFIFYGWWDWRFLFLIIASGMLDFGAGLGMQAYPQYKRFFLIISILGNVGSLVSFKYSGFIAENTGNILSAILGTPIILSVPSFMLILPVGISFYTFQSMSYTIDIYRGYIKPTRNILHFFAYLALFPQLVAGPIVRARDLLPQLTEVHYVGEQKRWEGLQLIVHGYFKKVVIADNLAPFVSLAFGASTPDGSSWYWWAIMTAFAFQIYCDFSGYSDIAQGLAKWMGYSFPANFNHPYISTSLREFWTRWHISLSTWFRDYVYIPLGGSQEGKWRSHLNMWCTMVISGIWHGAAWNFALWGTVHALYLSIERITRWPEWLSRFPLGRWLRWGVTIVQVWVAWVFFRAETTNQAFAIIKTMFQFQGDVHFGPGINGVFFLMIAVLREVLIAFSPSFTLSSRWQNAYNIVVTSLMIVACIYLRGPGSEFIYFQF